MLKISFVSHCCLEGLEDEGAFSLSDSVLCTGLPCSLLPDGLKSMDTIFVRLLGCFCKTVVFVLVCTEQFVVPAWLCLPLSVLKGGAVLCHVILLLFY